MATSREQHLEAALRTVRLECLLSIRRAAFGPNIGVRYTETIRAEIAGECRRLEDFIDGVLAERELEAVQPARETGS